jgi:hypothetical protein
MHDRYYRLLEAADLPGRSILVRIWQEDSAIFACIEGDDEPAQAAPDLVLFRAALRRLRENLMPVFVSLENAALWQADWGDLVDYRVTRKNGKPTLHRMQSPACQSARASQTLNLNSITSPSLTT